MDPHETKESRCRTHWSGNKSPLPPSTVVFFIEPAPLEVHSCPPSATFNLLPGLLLQGLLILYLLALPAVLVLSFFKVTLSSVKQRHCCLTPRDASYSYPTNYCCTTCVCLSPKVVLILGIFFMSLIRLNAVRTACSVITGSPYLWATKIKVCRCS